jgi:hypothetical protein
MDQYFKEWREAGMGGRRKPSIGVIDPKTGDTLLSELDTIC